MDQRVTRRSRFLALATITVIAALASSVGVAAAKPDRSKGHTAEIDVVVDPACSTITIESSKDISNLVFRMDGQDVKLEFSASIGTYELPYEASITDVWVKSGNNKSGAGAGYGEHFSVGCDDRLDLFFGGGF